jgi:L-fuculose-phosphate aldolase
MDNCQIIGSRAQSSEMLLHLEIYKTVPAATAVIHCHPPYATAHAIAGIVPQGNLVPEQEVFVGPVALTPYETPGTIEFARTILPIVKQHNTILLANHGVVCWADTVTHAEWYVEVVDTYCKTVMIASQLRSPLPEIPPDKIADLLAIKQRLGLPDARLPLLPDSATVFEGHSAENSSLTSIQPTKAEIEYFVDSLAAQIRAFIEKSA